jgi:PKD domain-containing protein
MRTFLLGTLLLGGGLAACDAYTTGPPAFMVGLATSAQTAARGDTVTFIVTAQGASLLGIDVSYGDGNGDQYGTGGARTARVTFRHAFDVAGTYVVRASVSDAVGGQKDASVQLLIN